MLDPTTTLPADALWAWVAAWMKQNPLTTGMALAVLYQAAKKTRWAWDDKLVGWLGSLRGAKAGAPLDKAAK